MCLTSANLLNRTERTIGASSGTSLSVPEDLSHWSGVLIGTKVGSLSLETSSSTLGSLICNK